MIVLLLREVFFFFFDGKNQAVSFSKLIHPRNLTRKSDFAGILRAGHASDYKHVSVLLSQSAGARRGRLRASGRPAPSRAPPGRAGLVPPREFTQEPSATPRPLPDLGRATSGAGINSMGERRGGERSAPAAGEEAGWPRRVGGGRTREAGQGGGQAPGSARGPSWETQLRINSVCFIISLQATLGEATSRGGRAVWVPLGLPEARLECLEETGGPGGEGHGDGDAPSQSRRLVTVPPPLPEASLRTQCTPREGMAPPRKEGVWALLS